MSQVTKMEWKEIAKSIYEATRIEARWSKRSIVPEEWKNRDEKFRNQFIEIIEKYLSLDCLPTPEEAHDSWIRSYLDMGWKYGEIRDTAKKTHPDLLPFDELPKDEKDKDAIFLSFVWLAKQLSTLSESRVRGEEREKFIKILDQEVYEWNESYGDEAIEYTQTKMAVEYIKQALANANKLSTPLKEK